MRCTWLPTYCSTRSGRLVPLHYEVVLIEKIFDNFGPFHEPLIRLSEMPEPVVHHLEATDYVAESAWKKGQDGVVSRAEPLTTLCCEDSNTHEVDTVFNLAFSVKKSDLKNITERILSQGGEVIEAPTEVSDEHGKISYAIVKSNCGNIVHTLINKDEYSGPFLAGFDVVENSENIECDSTELKISGIDHVTFACYSGNSERVIRFYERCFGMKRFQISNNDDEDNGLILADGVGLRLKAMQYWRCAETGLSYNKSSNPANAFMLVVVESLKGQTNCNVLTYLKQHKNEGVEHVALTSSSIEHTVSKLKGRGVTFRVPPKAYYDELVKTNKLVGLGQNVDSLLNLGILLDNENDSCEASTEESEIQKKYLMQIFSHPIFNLKTFFFEIIQRIGARGLGSGNILALVRSIREEERRNLMKSEAKKQEISEEAITCPRQC
ncbi:probable 4-hydroxyphenylpyruvate dioxygenase 2 [Caerostris darwini]|uniref:Probable 4-hydroxyphenylpyruvate dioxygenase 2 n=1 Tax=Caerostris darwini TaxID=1538125 RepID=A0AAV4V0E0_9ARAC|nr:probable 4-hydroxyphenylpyruvate dioxygenase 2 [Caerostris darwini]